MNLTEFTWTKNDSRNRAALKTGGGSEILPRQPEQQTQLDLKVENKSPLAIQWRYAGLGAGGGLLVIWPVSYTVVCEWLKLNSRVCYKPHS